ncbi:MAG: hypothetical protein OXU20_08230 [Myxococcales bacterium]|nr:hypothetical protein [Myxococcales bacterium]
MVPDSGEPKYLMSSPGDRQGGLHEVLGEQPSGGSAYGGHEGST